MNLIFYERQIIVFIEFYEYNLFKKIKLYGIPCIGKIIENYIK